MKFMRVSILAAACALVAVGVAAAGSSGAKHAGSARASFTVGYSLPTGQNVWINAIAATAKSDVVKAGGTMQTSDAALDPGKAVQQVSRFVDDGVQAIVIGPAQVPQSLIAPLSKAKAKGIHTFALEWSFTTKPNALPTAPVDGQASIDRGKLGRDVAAAVKAGAGGTPHVVYVGLPFPVTSLDFFEQNLKAALGSSGTYVNLDNPTDNAQGALGPLNGALAAHPETNAIVTYNGPSALAAVQAVKAHNMTGKVKIYNIQLDSSTAAALKAGQLAACWDLNPPALGHALGQLIVASVTGKPKSTWAKTVVVDAPKYTKANIDMWKDWSH